MISAPIDNRSKAQQRRVRLQHERTDAVRSENKDYYKIVAMMPGNLPPDVCDDIAQWIFVDGSVEPFPSEYVKSL